MTTKLRRWLSGLEFLFANRQPYPRNKAEEDPSLGDLAFALATADDMRETLPRALTTIQHSLAASFSYRERCNVLVLFSCPTTSESFLHHAMETKPSGSFVRELHRVFTLNKPPEQHLLTIDIDGYCATAAPRKLLESSDLTLWLLFHFEDAVPSMEEILWRTSAIERAMMKGLSAWQQREEKVKTALRAERSIYAAELHDSIAQMLGYLRLKSAELDKLCQQATFADLKPMTEDLAAYTHCAYRQTRELIISSRLTMQTKNLSEGVINSIDEFEQQSAIVFELDNRLPRSRLNPKQSMQILYIVRESLSNIVRHSHATHARVSLVMKHADTLQVVIEDNGTGIQPEAARSDSFGMLIMHERAERIGAALDIGPRAGGGTRTELTLTIGEPRD